jgi:hypothetical protein
MKTCGNCGTDISERAPQARFCTSDACHTERMLAHGRASYDRHRVDIRRRQNAAHRTRVAARPPRQIFCQHCDVEILHKRGRAKWCSQSCRDRARHALNPTRARSRAARRRGCPGNGIGPQAWVHLKRRHGGRCVYCGTIPVLMTVDHVVPLERGGWDSEGNVVPACKPCNCSKGALLLVEWRKAKRLTHSRS